MNENLKNFIALKLGQVSMCWSERPTGVFQDEKVTMILDEIMEQIEIQKNKETTNATLNNEFPIETSNEPYAIRFRYIRDAKKYLKENPSDEISDLQERTKRTDMILRTVRYILETPEAKNVITHAEDVMSIVNQNGGL